MADVSDLNSDNAVYRTLLESTKAIPWKIDWASKRFTYIGPQIEELLGWQPESWMSVEDWAARMHPEDRENVVNFCVAQSQAGVDHEADYRALTTDTGHVWIRTAKGAGGAVVQGRVDEHRQPAPIQCEP